MSREAVGFPCPECGSDGTHEITTFIEVDHFVLHCRTCEATWPVSVNEEAS
jgi:uncharacterized Zn finger protein